MTLKLLMKLTTSLIGSQLTLINSHAKCLQRCGKG